MSGSSRRCVAVYRRTVRASVERVWENVFDWEHLPWLHGGSFSRIEHIASGTWGWRAQVGLQPTGDDGILLELVREGSENRYVARTLAGPGADSEIWTRLTPDASGHTGVEVEFCIPGVPPSGVDSVGAAFRQLYTRLCDEDEAMMLHRSRQLAARAEPRGEEERELGTLAELRTRLPVVVEFGGRSYRVVDLGGELAVHACTCPHRLGPLADCSVVDGRIRCPWHGYEFDVRSGRSSDGRRLRLPPAPRLVVDSATSGVRLTRKGQ